MATSTFTLTSTELACGVTLDDVQREVPRMMIRDSGATLVIDGTLAPALGSALARFHYGERPHKFTHINHKLGLAVYVLE